MNTTTFAQLNLRETTLSAVDDAGYDVPTEVQRRAIPELIAGRDVLATAQTGTGKTAAFVLPLLQRVQPTEKRDRQGWPSALILTPTRELAVQIVESAQTYGKGSPLRTLAIYGGASRNRQITELKDRPEVLVATPGRLMDLIDDGFIRLEHVSYLVLDEADRMLDMGFIPAVRKIVGMTPKARQTALFSATMPPTIQSMAREFLRDPVRVEAEAGELRVEKIDQSVMYIEQANKLELLPQLIRDRGMFRVLVFTRTKHRARKVAKVLSKQGLDADAIHGDKSQSARLRALSDFRKGKIHVLVATDVASRGIDIDDITHVVNFEIPNEPETYVHRIGRTARAGNIGCAISFCDESEMPYVRDIEKLIGATLAVDANHAFHEERKVHAASSPQRGPQGRSGSRPSGTGRPRNAGGPSRGNAGSRGSSGRSSQSRRRRS
ncbi:MAG TPA: DEAD/DEAH box helicase [Spirochaetia bacterium]|nr:DEAD/DEAH box helicase [Spirochaetia bacterium]